MGLTQAQVDTLLNPIKPHRVLHAQGQSHVAAFDVIAHLSRVFGFGGWDKEILSLDVVHERIAEQEQKGGKYVPPRCWVTYRCVMRLTIKDPDGNPVAHYEDAATGSAQNMPGVGDAHDFAVKNAVSYAVKRCAKDLGDQFGLSLYNKGRTEALVGRTLVMPGADGPGREVDVESSAPAPLVLGNDETHVEDSGVGAGGDGTNAEEATGAGVAAPTPDTGDVDEQRRRIRAAKAQMTAAQKTFLQEWMTGEEIVPATATHAQLDAIEVECARILEAK